MRIEEAVIAHLKADPGVAALVVARVYGPLLPEGISFPALTTQRVSTPQTFDTHQGESGVREARWQITAHGRSSESAAVLADAVEAALHCFSGMFGGGVSVGRCRTVNRTQLSRDSNSLLFGELLDLLMIYNP